MQYHPDNLVCPTDQSPLEKRTGKYVDFWGCSSYAKTGCRYILKEQKTAKSGGPSFREGEDIKSQRINRLNARTVASQAAVELAKGDILSYKEHAVVIFNFVLKELPDQE